MENFTKIIHPCDCPIGEKKYPVFCKIKFENGNLSISGVIGPKSNGNAWGGCGQIDMEFKHADSNHDDKRYSHLIPPSDLRFANGWNQTAWYKFLETWKCWHLNDMQAGCEHQRAEKWENKRIDPKELPNSHTNRDANGIIATWVTEKEHKDGLLSKACTTCGYKYGSAWLKTEVPENVLTFLKELPDTDRQPHWV